MNFENKNLDRELSASKQTLEKISKAIKSTLRRAATESGLVVWFTASRGVRS